MSVLKWNPQEAFRDYFYTEPREIKKYQSVFRLSYEYFVAYGGRGSAKTWTFVDAIVVESSLRPVRVLVTRELQVSIDESIKAEIEAAIEKRGLSWFYTITQNAIVGKNGSRFIFKGIKNNINNIKSIADVDIVIVEEAESVSKTSWDKLLPSIRPKSGRPIVVVIFNPEDELADTYQRWAVSPPTGTISKCINWRDNKYFPKYLDRQRLHCLNNRPKKEYDHIWEGKPVKQSENIIIDLEWIKAARFASRLDGFEQTEGHFVAYDPAGQGKDENARVYAHGNIVKHADEWTKSDDLRVATEDAFETAELHGKQEFEKHESIQQNVYFIYDACGGFGDGVSVFVSDAKDSAGSHGDYIQDFGFDAGAEVANKDDPISESDYRTWGSQYSNAKAQAWAILADKLYKTYRFVVQEDKTIDPEDMISIDIEDDDTFLKLCRELSAPLWIKSRVNSKKQVESKEEMRKRGIESPNMADALVMCYAPLQDDDNFGELLKMSVGN